MKKIRAASYSGNEYPSNIAAEAADLLTEFVSIVQRDPDYEGYWIKQDIDTTNFVIDSLNNFVQDWNSRKELEDS